MCYKIQFFRQNRVCTWAGAGAQSEPGGGRLPWSWGIGVQLKVELISIALLS